MAKLRAQHVAAQREMDREGRVEDAKELATFRDSLKGGSKGGGGGRAKAASTTSERSGPGKLKYVQTDAEGFLIGQDESGNWIHPVDESGQRVRGQGKSARSSSTIPGAEHKDPLGSGVIEGEVESTPAPAMPPKPSAAPDAPLPPPKPGDIYEGSKFKGGNPRDPANWEKQSSAEAAPMRVAQNVSDPSAMYGLVKKAIARFQEAPTDANGAQIEMAIRAFMEAAEGDPRWAEQVREVQRWFDTDTPASDYQLAGPALLAQNTRGLAPRKTA